MVHIKVLSTMKLKHPFVLAVGVPQWDGQDLVINLPTGYRSPMVPVKSAESCSVSLFEGQIHPGSIGDGSGGAKISFNC